MPLSNQGMSGPFSSEVCSGGLPSVCCGLLGAGGVTGVTGASGLAVPPVSPPEDELPPLLSGVVGRKGWFGVVSPPVEGGAGVTDG